MMGGFGAALLPWAFGWLFVETGFWASCFMLLCAMAVLCLLVLFVSPGDEDRTRAAADAVSVN